MKKDAIRVIITAGVIALVSVFAGVVQWSAIRTSTIRQEPATPAKPEPKADDGIAAYRRLGWVAGAQGKTLSDSRPRQNLTGATDDELRSWDAGWTQGAAEYLMNREKDRALKHKEKQ